MKGWLGALVLVLGLVSPASAKGALFPQAPAGGPFVRAEFGYSVSMSGDTVAVGTIEETPGGEDAGSVYIFVRSGTTWSLQQRILASDGAPFDYFGSSVSLSGDTLVVGAPYDDLPAGETAGSAYVFVRTGTRWSQQQKLISPDPAPQETFGSSVAVSGDTLVVGAANDGWTPSGFGPGAAYVFGRSGTTWTHQQKLIVSISPSDDEFGYSVSLDGDTLVVGAPLEDLSGGRTNYGSAYVFVRAGTTWSQQQKLTGFDAVTEQLFGWRVSVSGDSIAVGAPHDQEVGSQFWGAAYVFVRSGTAWSEQQKLVAPQRMFLDFFGGAVSLSGDTLGVGSMGDDTAGPNTGSAHVFVRSGTVWSRQQNLTASDAATSDSFGNSVSVAGDTAIVGAYFDVNPSGVGSAYVFARSGTAWTQQQKLTPPGKLPFHTLPPCRVVDTRTTAAPLAANSTRTFPVGGVCGVPADAHAVAVSLIAVNPGDSGDLRLYPSGQPMPLASAINFTAGKTRASNAVLTLGADREIDVRCDMPPGSTAATHFVLDVFGYFK